jgi:hypothetical protein
MKRTMMMVVVLALAGTVYGQAPAARISDIRGTVEIQSPGASTWHAAREGETLDAASMVSTGFRSTAQIRVGNSVITVRPLTRLSLEALQAAGNNERVDLSLRTGRVRADVNPREGRQLDFTVRGPVVTASVRGTTFELDMFNLEVEEGIVGFSGIDGTVVSVSAGQSSAVSAEVVGQTTAAEESVIAQAAPPPAGTDGVVPPPKALPFSMTNVEIQW